MIWLTAVQAGKEHKYDCQVTRLCWTLRHDFIGFDTRKLGKSGIVISALGLGCMAIGGPWTRTHRGIQFYPGKVDEHEAIRAILRAVELGINFFDTAANYGTGRSERLLGQALAGQRDKVLIATKFGYQLDEPNNQVGYYDNDVNSSQVIHRLGQDCEASLRRLATDYIDLYQFHVADYAPDKASDVVEELEKLVQAGKIRFYGWSTDDPERAAVFARGEHCTAIQHQLNIVDDNPAMLKFCDESDLASINHSPLGAGLLTGKYRIDHAFPKEDRRSTDYYQKEWIPPMVGAAENLRTILTQGNRTLAQGALAWIWTRSNRTIPIPGFKTVAQVEENVAAMRFGPLTTEQMEQIDTLLERTPTPGG